jgi:Mn2+/Fe2+ NRAMP family transporter
VGTRSGFSSIFSIVYLVIGLVVASDHAFFGTLNAVMPILSAVLAVLLWPLILLGVDLHLH